MKIAALFLSLIFAPPYDRGAFRHWVDVDRDCQDTRAEVLISRSLDPDGLRFRGFRGCSVRSGTWVDTYSGRVVSGSSLRVQIDHLVPLVEAWDSGAWEWTPERRKQFANDPENLVITTSSANASKGGKDIAEWVPEGLSRQCWYSAAWRSIKAAYGLSYDPAEVAAIIEIEKRCQGD